jgi:hypothetical protein
LSDQLIDFFGHLSPSYCELVPYLPDNFPAYGPMDERFEQLRQIIGVCVSVPALP